MSENKEKIAQVSRNETANNILEKEEEKDNKSTLNNPQLTKENSIEIKAFQTENMNKEIELKNLESELERNKEFYL